MVDVVAKALCGAAGKSCSPVCSCCETLPTGERVCVYWETFREEARAVIIAAHAWYKKERRWPGFVKP